jgi:hypothetical protein
MRFVLAAGLLIITVAFQIRMICLFRKMMDQVNSAVPKGARIPEFGPSWLRGKVIQLHRELFPAVNYEESSTYPGLLLSHYSYPFLRVLFDLFNVQAWWAFRYFSARLVCFQLAIMSWRAARGSVSRRGYRYTGGPVFRLARRGMNSKVALWASQFLNSRFMLGLEVQRKRAPNPSFGTGAALPRTPYLANVRLADRANPVQDYGYKSDFHRTG